MPAQRPRASFEPIPPDFDVRALVENTENFQYVDRISVDMIKQQGVEQFEKLVLLHVVIGGKPLVVDGFEDVLDPWSFTPEWLAANCGDKVENARNLTAKENLPLTIGHYLKNMSLLTNQFFEGPENYKDKNRQRIYLKDIDCPQVWHDKLKEHIPSGLFYLNESTGEIGGLGAVDDPNAGGRKGRGIARAGDLMSSLPPEMRAENLMCYIGHEGTYTPSHREMCASLGQNIMVNASGTVGEDGKPEKPGSSIWFMTESKDRHLVSEYWLSVLGHDIEVENHFAQVAAWKRAPFKTYVVEQRPGDFILIPPLAPHQVWNRGTRTMKVAWNRTTVETLEMAFNEALPNARMVCRDEQYKNKAIVYYTLLKYSSLLKQAKMQSEASPNQALLLRRSSKVQKLQRDFKRLFELYKHIMLSEMFSPDLPKEHSEFVPFESYVTCAYCRGNIFNRFLTCKSCSHALGTNEEEPYDVCMDCYAMGRSCACISGLQWVEQWRWKDLLYKYEEWRKQVLEIDGGRLTDTTPVPLSEERRSLQKKTLAQICQEQLKQRPWVDYKNPNTNEDDEKSDEEIIVNDDGTVRRTAKKRSKAWLAKNQSCHVCFHRHPTWKMAKCTTCDLWYCYGSLFRAHDLMPQTIMEDPRWQCPHCRRVCNTGACRRDPRQQPYDPKGTLLGHDTKKVADARSVEALVDFSVSNLNWLRDEEAAPAESARLQRRREEAERAKAANPAHDDRYVDEDAPAEFDERPTQIEYSPVEDDSFLDPALRSGDGDGVYLPGPSAMLHGVRPRNNDPPLIHPGDDEGYSGHAVDGQYVFNDMDVDDNSLYPELDREVDSVQVFRSSSKRGYDDSEDHIKLVSKKPRTSKEKSKPTQAKSDATKQFYKKKEKQKLEQAKRDGRYIQVWGAMRGRKAMVTLRLPSEKLEVFRQRDIDRRKRAQLSLRSDARDSAMQDIAIIQSDITAPKGQVPAATNGAKVKKPKARVALDDEDDDYASRRGRKGTGKKRYEEIDESDQESEELEGEEAYAPRQRRRRDSEDLVQLPDNWKEGRANPRADRKRRQTAMPTRAAGTQIRPPGSTIPARASTGTAEVISDDNSDSENDASPEPEVAQPEPQRPQLVAPMNRQPSQSQAAEEKEQEKAKAKAREAEAQRLAAAAQALEEENRLAKLEAARWADEDDDTENIGQLDGSSDVAPSPARPRTAVAPMQQANGNSKPSTPKADPPRPPGRPSIMDRYGRSGKKIKIVSAASKRQSSATAASTPAEDSATKTPASSARATPVAIQQHSAPATSSFTAVNKPATASIVAVPAGIIKRRSNSDVLQLSDTDSDADDEIPARAPPPVAVRQQQATRGKTGRPRGRPRKAR